MRFINWDLLRSPDRGKTAEAPDYSGLTDDQLLDSFRSDNWEGLSDTDKIAVIQELEYRSAAMQGRTPAKVLPLNNIDYYGQYVDVYNNIYINVSNSSSYEALDTYFHESNHAYQIHCISTGEGYDEYTLAMFAVETARDGRGVLYNYTEERSLYIMQCTEMDCNSVAFKAMHSLNARYADDPEYAAYVSKRAVCFKDITTKVDSKADVRASMQNRQALAALEHGDISEQQFLLIQRVNAAEDYTDPVVNEARKAMDTAEAEASRLNRFPQQDADSYIGRLGEQQGCPDTAGEYMGSVKELGEQAAPEMGAYSGGMESSQGME